MAQPETGSVNRSELQAGLRQAGLSHDAELLEQSAAANWYVQASLGCGAWSLSLLGLLLLFVLDWMDHKSSRFLLGLAMVGGSCLLSRLPRCQGQVFLEQLSLTGALLGMLCWLLTFSSLSAQLGVLLLVYGACPQFAVRLLAVVAAGFLVAVQIEAEVPCAAAALLAGGLWIHYRLWRLSPASPWLRPLAYGSCLVLFGYLYPDFGDRAASSLPLLALLALWSAASEQRQLHLPWLGRLGLLATALVVAASSWTNPGGVLGFMLLLPALSNRERPLLLLASLFLVVSIGLHYYDLSLDLTSKGLVMTTLGALLLGCSFCFREKS